LRQLDTGLVFLHNASDFLIWTAYIAIPLVFIKFAYAKRRELNLPHKWGQADKSMSELGPTYNTGYQLHVQEQSELCGHIRSVSRKGIRSADKSVQRFASSTTCHPRPFQSG